jgi:hypothetical protein
MRLKLECIFCFTNHVLLNLVSRVLELKFLGDSIIFGQMLKLFGDNLWILFLDLSELKNQEAHWQ